LRLLHHQHDDVLDLRHRRRPRRQVRKRQAVRFADRGRGGDRARPGGHAPRGGRGRATGDQQLATADPFPSEGHANSLGDVTPLENTVALVTGASSGIGEATATELASLGAKVALVARRGDRLQSLAERIGEGALVIEADVSDQGAAAAAIESTVSEFGRLDTLVNNAGVMLLGPVQDAPLEEWERMIGVNLRGLLYCTHAALPHLLKAAEDSPRQVADIVNVSSVAGRVARLGSGVYNLTKHGVGAFSESLRQEVTQRHVRVSLVEPGAVSTELASHNRPEIQEGMRQRFGSIERMEAQDIADAIAYIVTRPRRVAINEVLIRPTEQQN
jgi:NADP-dependent 3-hydroxy acid dehydrogenase YdfG